MMFSVHWAVAHRICGYTACQQRIRKPGIVIGHNPSSVHDIVGAERQLISILQLR